MSKRLVLAVGPVGTRAGTLAQVMGKLGFRVPAQRVCTARSGVAGDSETRWAGRFHDRLLRRAQVLPDDTRPGTFLAAARQADDPTVRTSLGRWLSTQFNRNPHVIVNGDGLAWFLPLWLRAARTLDAEVGTVIMIRHPLDCLASATATTSVDSSIAAWINVTLHLEVSTRGLPRALVRTEDLHSDWAHTVAGLCQALHLPLLGTATTGQMRSANLALSQRPSSPHAGGWGSIDVHPELAKLAEEVWRHLVELDTLGDSRVAWTQLDRDLEIYESSHDLEAGVAHSSIVAAHRAARAVGRRESRDRQANSGHGATLLRRVRRLVPHRWRRLVPLPWRTAAVRLVTRRSDTS